MRNRCLCALLVPALLAACAPGTEYRKAKVIEPMTVPDDVPFESGEPLYQVPLVDQRLVYNEDEKKFEAPPPPQMLAPEGEPDAEDDARAPGQDIQVTLSRDGNGYPIIMMRTRFAWAWEHVNNSLRSAGFEVEDRNRTAGIFYLRVPRDIGASVKSARLKLSQTANGIQLAVLEPGGEALLKKETARTMLDRLYEEL